MTNEANTANDTTLQTTVNRAALDRIVNFDLCLRALIENFIRHDPPPDAMLLVHTIIGAAADLVHGYECERCRRELTMGVALRDARHWRDTPCAEHAKPGAA